MDDSLSSRTAFLDHLTEINLRRIWWIIIASTVVSAGIFLSNLLHPSMRIGELAALQMVDFAVSALFLFATWYLCRPRNAGMRTARRVFVIVFAVTVFATMDAYYVRMLPILGENAAFVLGMVTIGIALILPPVVLVTLLLTNCLFVFLFLFFSGVRGHLLSTLLLDGTAGVLVASIAGIFLFRAKFSDFAKGRLLAERNRELERSADEMSEVMAIAAHDLRSPLFAMESWLGATARRVTSDDRIETRSLASPLDSAATSCRTMLSLIERLLSAHEADSLPAELPRESRNLNACLSAAMQRHCLAAEAKSIRLAFELPAEPVHASVHAPSLNQVLDNLISNALKFSPSGTTIRLSVLQEPGAVLLAVSDEGPGIPEAERLCLFQKFHRGVSQPTGGEPTSGLGLFIARKLMDSMGGTISYQPNTPKGSVFVLRFPDQ